MIVPVHALSPFVATSPAQKAAKAAVQQAYATEREATPITEGFFSFNYSNGKWVVNPATVDIESYFGDITNDEGIPMTGNIDMTGNI